MQKPEPAETELRGLFRADAEGRFIFQTIKPSSYPIPIDGPVGQMLQALGRDPHRLAHVHFIVSAPGFKTLTTELFVEGDPYLDSDVVFGVRDSLVVPFVHHATADGDAPLGARALFYTVDYDFVLEPA